MGGEWGRSDVIGQSYEVIGKDGNYGGERAEFDAQGKCNPSGVVSLLGRLLDRSVAAEV